MLCSGKVYFDLVKARAEKGDDTVALVRVEQLYPFPRVSLGEVLRRYRNAEIVWCQEEPENMGAWGFVDRRIEQVLAGLDVAAQAAALCRPRRGRLARPPACSSAMCRSRRSSSTRRWRRDAAAMSGCPMTVEIRVPTLGELVTEATVAKWLKQPGERVERDEPVVELETDKVTLEVPAPQAGVIGEIQAAEGGNVPVGAVLGTIADGAAAAAPHPGPLPLPRARERESDGRRRVPSPRERGGRRPRRGG